jgi:hypothetical protein
MDPAADVGPGRDKANMMDALEHAGFKSMHIYDEGHSHFAAPWTYLVCFKDYETRSSWYKTAPELEIEMHERLYRTKSGRPTLLYFDAPAMMGYQLPSRAHETSNCRREDKPKECDEFPLVDPKFLPISHRKAQMSAILGLSADEYHTEINVDLHNAGNLSAPIFSPITERHMRLFSVRDFLTEYGHN